MSKRDIVSVCELAAHLAIRYEAVARKAHHFMPYVQPEKCAADAMTLQRLGRSARNLVKRGAGGPNAMQWVQRIVDQGNAILKPYWLGCCFDYDEAPHFFVIGLPGNTEGGEGFAI